MLEISRTECGNRFIYIDNAHGYGHIDIDISIFAHLSNVYYAITVMFDDKLRNLKEKMYAPVARRLTHVPPLLLTVCAFLCGLAATLYLYQAHYRSALLLWLISRVIDGLDGTVARINKKSSALGGYLDIVFDVIIYALFPIAAAFAADTVAIYIAALFLVASFYFNIITWSMLSAILEKRSAQSAANHTKRFTTVVIPRGLIEGFETIVIFSLFCIIPQYLLLLFISMAALTTIGAIIRVIWATQKL